MFASGPLLVSQQGEKGTFSHWLKKLGLEEFIKRYSVEKLVRWGWLVPRYRMVFPNDFFLSWEDFPCLGVSLPDEHKHYSLLWDSTWSTEPDHNQRWPLHPFFHPDNETATILATEGQYKQGSELPEALEHPRGSSIKPYADFFFHWQAYALIDVIRFADCIEPILHTPEIMEHAKGIVQIAEHLQKWRAPNEILSIETRWGGLSRVMTWISHYRSFVEALDAHHSSKAATHAEHIRDRKAGAIALAEILNITAENLAVEIKDRLLVLASEWMSDSPKTSRWVKKAWPHLQKDITLATIWLSHLSGRTFESYLLEWSYKGPLRERWAQLSDVLPWDFWAERTHFLRLAGKYVRNAELGFSADGLLSDEGITERVDTLRKGNYPFQSFLGAFKSLHDHLGARSFDQTGEDFRDLRPLDHYSLLAIRAEGVLLYTIDHLSPSVTIKDPKLETYITYLAERQNISAAAIMQFKSHCKTFTQLKSKPDQPIRAIIGLALELSTSEQTLVKAFLCCVLARNYFAHHYYLDGKQLPRSEESAFLLGGVIATVLLLACLCRGC